MDIGGGGVALVCEEHDTEFQPGKVYSVCNIQLPDVGLLTATILVKNIFIITMHNGEVKKRAGCEFIHLNGTMAILLRNATLPICKARDYARLTHEPSPCSLR